MPVLGLHDVPFYARVAAVAAAALTIVSVAVSVRSTGRTFEREVGWAPELEAAQGGGLQSFAGFKLASSVKGQGSIVTSTPGPFFAEGQQVIITAQPAPGATFVRWGGDVEGDTSPMVVRMTGDLEVTAEFVTDRTPPVLSEVVVEPAAASAVVRWRTDEPSTSRVQVGTSNAYELGPFERLNLTRDHNVTITGLEPGREYHYAISSANGAQATAVTPDGVFATAGGSGPGINVWYGNRQLVGAHGRPQNDYGLLGNVTDPDGLASLSYSLNGGAARELTIGPDLRRVQSPGDFNADIPYDELQPGENTVVITATDGNGATSSQNVVLDYQYERVELPYETDWKNAGAISDQAQIVDGQWGLDGETVRPLELGYDRLLMVGDKSWQDYEMTVPVTAHAIGPNAGAENSGAALVGIALNWNGHSQVRQEQPKRYWYPTGALGWYRWYDPNPKFELRGNLDRPIVRMQRNHLQFDRTYVFKARSQTVEGGVQYSWKVWPQGTPEPASWDLVVVEDDGPPTGSVGVIAHHLDVQFGDIRVTPIDG